MKESILHYIWQQKLFFSQQLKTTEGEPVQVIDVGKLNTDGGPDFFNAKVKIGDTLWAGNIEIHTVSGDWYKHNHHLNRAYDSVVLHVVKTADAKIYRNDGEKIPQLELKYPPEIEKNYEALLQGKKWIPCSAKIADVPALFIHSWKNALLAERLVQKTDFIAHLLQENKQHWEEAFYISLARSFGFSTNSQAFEMLAKSLSVEILGKHKANLFQIEALLFGQSGLLPVASADSYCEQLKKEYAFLKAKYHLQPIDGSQWKLLRLRPDNFPHVRLAQFAAIVHSSSKLFSKIIEFPTLEYLTQLIQCEPSEYWKTHYLFAETSAEKTKKLGQASMFSLLINSIIPFIFSYADHKGNDALKEIALGLLEKIPAEQNAIVTGWRALGMEIANAYDSQAFLQLKKCYCDDKNCLRCRIGHKVLTKKV
ncbi:MAG: hypothetical protein AUK44_09220 [Porphyromonadaceae bacterium CG2_30_38_12]|nr:MAG: hypothetical protein AUK44_09220 [Porphyromonadaceae bacterium CG2_30_38_12]